MTQAGERLDDYEQRMRGIAARAELAKQQLAAARPSASSPDGAVTVTVNSAGALTDIAFGAAADGLDRAELAKQVLQASAQARRAAAVLAQQAVAGLVGEGSAALAVMRDEVPAAPDEPVAAPPRPPAPEVDEEDEGFPGRGL